jgi:hypothetical protein
VLALVRSKTYVRLARTIYIYIWCIYGGFGRETTEFMVIYGVYLRFWPTLDICVLIKKCIPLISGDVRARLCNVGVGLGNWLGSASAAIL